MVENAQTGRGDLVTAPRRFALTWIWLGVGVSFLVSVAIGVLWEDLRADVGRAADAGGYAEGSRPFLTSEMVNGAWIAIAVLGVVLAALPGSSRRRGVGLGLLLGWLVTLVVVIVGMMLFFASLF